MKKGLVIGIIAIVVILILCIFVVYPNYTNKQKYVKYYEKSCKDQNLAEIEQEYSGDSAHNEAIKEVIQLCLDTGGCFNLCGDTCHDINKFSFTILFKPKRDCTEIGCLPQCVCPYGKELNVDIETILKKESRPANEFWGCV